MHALNKPSRHYRSFAKINLHLQVDARWEDGYHQLRTIFQTVSLHDRLRLRQSDRPGLRLTVPGGGAPAGEANLAYRAAAAVLARWAPEMGLDIELRKSIPAGGGLGGGSSNAATVLLALADMLEISSDDVELVMIARGLGADVPYFLVGGTALGEGRGDDIVPLQELAEQEVVLVDPGVSVSTAEIFAALPRPERRLLPASVARAVDGGETAGIAEMAGSNDLESVVFEKAPEVLAVYTALRIAGATFVRVSGSGGTVFACFAKPQRAAQVESYLPRAARVFVARTLSRSAVNRQRLVVESES